MKRKLLILALSGLLSIQLNAQQQKIDTYAWKGIADANKPYLHPEVLKIKTEI